IFFCTSFPSFPFVQKYLLIPEQRALNDRVHERTGAKPARGGAVEDAFHLRPVAEANGCAGGVRDELADQVARELPLVGQQESLQLADIVERSAVGQRGGWVDRLCRAETERLAILSEPCDGRAHLAQRTILIAEPAEDVERFEREAGRVDLRVA